jgi:hypothetical protein
MEGQLHYDGVVVPMSEVTWQTVLAKANTLNGLDVGADFVVTYKDEDGESIQVQNQTDLTEAIRWARENGVPSLCLNVPGSADESDSDNDSWEDVVEDGSPRRSQPVQVVEESAPELNLNHHEEEEESLQVEEESLPIEESHEPHGQEQTVPPVETQHEIVHLESVETPMQTAVEVTPIQSVFQQMEAELPEEVPTEACRTSSPILLTPRSFMFEEVAVNLPSSPSVVAPQTAAVDNLVELLYSANHPSEEGEADDKTLLLQFMSDPVSVFEAVSLMSHSEIQSAMVTVAEAEKANPGTALKIASTQMIKVMFKNPDLAKQLSNIPNLETILPRVLRKLKPVSTKTEVSSAGVVAKPSVVHQRVVCDGCESNEALKAQALEAGHRIPSQNCICGLRYKSGVVPDFDLCETCEGSGIWQQSHGPFLKIVDPATAPEAIMCVLPGATAGMTSQADNLDWRNPLANAFKEFMQSRRQRAFPQQRGADAIAAASPVGPSAAPAPVLRCTHSLTQFETSHGSFTCDVCMKKQAARTVMHGCRSCNFDVCEACNVQHGIVPSVVAAAPPPPPQVVVTASVPAEPTPPQAKFISDVTLADGCVVRPGEKLSKIWRVRNSGAEPWPAGTRIGHVGGDAFGGPLSGVEVPLAAPGQAVNVSVPLVMPTQPGRYTSYWRMMTPNAHAKFGHRFWVTVNVVPQVAAAVPVPVGQARAFPGQIIRAPPPPPPTVQGLRGIFPAPPPPSMSGFVAGSPVVARAGAARPPPPPPASMQADEEPVVMPELELAVAQITEFGFTDIDKIVKILKDVNGDASAAIDKLLEEA